MTKTQMTNILAATTVHGGRLTQIERTASSALVAIDELIKEKPMLAAKICGHTTLGNIRAELKGALIDLAGPNMADDIKTIIDILIEATNKDVIQWVNASAGYYNSTHWTVRDGAPDPNSKRLIFDGGFVAKNQDTVRLYKTILDALSRHTVKAAMKAAKAIKAQTKDQS